MQSGEPGLGSGAEPPDDGPEAAASAAFQRLFEQHFPELYRFAYRYVRAEETAKDLVGDAFLRLWQQRDQVDLGGPTARSYLYTVVRYRAIQRLREILTQVR